MEGQPWLFRKNLIIFDRLTEPIQREQIKLTSSPFWIKIGPCSPELDKKDLLHAIGVMVGGIIRSEINGEFCRLRVNLDVQNPLRRGIFVSTDNCSNSWISFKYEKLPTFCFGCGRMEHGLQGCKVIKPAGKEKVRDNPPFSLALKAELALLGKECLKLNALSKKFLPQRSYIEKTEENQGTHPQEEDSTDVSPGKQDIAQLTEVEIVEERPERCVILDGKSSGNNDIMDGMLKPSKKSSWKRAKSTKERSASVGESKLGKRKLLEIEAGEYGPDGIWEVATKKRRYGQPTLEIIDGIFLQEENSNRKRSAAAKRQADRMQ